jgi:hypothetical protein
VLCPKADGEACDVEGA